jgi:hypothetical protein
MARGFAMRGGGMWLVCRSLACGWRSEYSRRTSARDLYVGDDGHGAQIAGGNVKPPFVRPSHWRERNSPGNIKVSPGRFDFEDSTPDPDVPNSMAAVPGATLNCRARNKGHGGVRGPGALLFRRF